MVQTVSLSVEVHAVRQHIHCENGKLKIDMITKFEARQIAEKAIGEYSQPENDCYVILDNETIEKDWGWVFCYTSKLYLETNELIHAVVGNAPLFVLRENGKVLISGTSHDIDYYVDRFEATGNPHS